MARFVNKTAPKVNFSRSIYAAKPDIVEVLESLTTAIGSTNQCGGRVYEMVGLKSGNIEGFEKFSQFSSLQELNTHIEMWLAVHKHDFSKGALVGLKRLVRFSAKIPGVCNAKIGTILKAIHAEYCDHGISRSTFKRMIQKA
ncbi:hypothetical protein [Bacillus sp. ISL-46]|uniref:hypothetical protein n=1 Tax=Bacillus sp. ISL-46 TaxID=2819129 RepID=UPI0020363932|nr:hypothetical protein [Bacillus sp. ISL-46]